MGHFKGNTAWWGTMGILTKISTKVYPFQPEPLVPEGLNQDAALVLPPRVRWQNYTMPTEDALQDALMEMAREQICAAMNRVPLFWREINRGGGRSEFWERWKAVTPEQCAETHILRLLFIGYTSQEQLDYEMRVVEDIAVKKYGGTARRTKQTDNGAFLYSIVTGMWKPTGFYASENVGYASPRATWAMNDELVDRANVYLTICSSKKKKEKIQMRTFDDIYQFSIIKLNQGEYEEALKLLGKAGEMKPKEGKIPYLMANAYCLMGEMGDRINKP